MFQKYVGVDISTLWNNGLPGRNGEGVSMGLSIGAALHLPVAVMYNGGRVKDTAKWYSPVNLAFFRQYNFRVNENGVRYWNEAKVGDFTAHGNSIRAQLKNISIIDQAYLDILTDVGLFYGTATMGYPTGSPVPEIPDEIAKNSNVIVADSLEEIADAFGIDKEGLLAEVERYNGFCEAGVDLDYEKPAQYLQPVSTPPYYAAELIPSFFTTVGGLKVNVDIQVTNETGKAIDHLYACGSDAGGLYGHCYDVAAASGSQQGWSATSGKLAVEHAMKTYVRS
jgi:fumarate reductase flavoprotein subunit